MLKGIIDPIKKKFKKSFMINKLFSHEIVKILCEKYSTTKICEEKLTVNKKSKRVKLKSMCDVIVKYVVVNFTDISIKGGGGGATFTTELLSPLKKNCLHHECF